MTSTLNTSYKLNKGLWVFSWLFLLAFLIRFPFFFRDYIDKDESTFILMGQSWVEGNLPYTFLWDLKPPLTFGFFAAIIAVFGKSFFWIRLGGVLLVSATSYFVYKLISTVNKNQQTAKIIALLSLLSSSLFGSVQGVMSEHISITIFVWGLYLLCLPKKVNLVFLGGFLLGLSAMTKLNLAYPILLMGGYIAWTDLTTNPFKKGLARPLYMALGIIMGIGVTAIPYLSNGILAVWWRSVFLASGSYAQINLYNSLIITPFIILLCVFFIKSSSFVYKLVGVGAIGVLASFIMAGKINGHYLLQAYPLLFILLGIGIGDKKIVIRKIWWLLFAIAPIESYIEYANIFSCYNEKQSFYNGEGIEIPNYLKAAQIDLNSVLFFEYHIGYWLLDKTPPSMAVTHPSNLFRPRLFPYFNSRKKSQEELEYLLDSLKPAVIVINKDHSLFKEHIKEKAYFEKYIHSFYTKDTLIGKGVIYIRK